MPRPRSSLTASDHDPTVDLTPLIDVVFVILMTFVIAVPMISLDHVQLAPGTTQHPQTLSETPRITIKVRADHSVEINDQLIPDNQLPDVMRKLYQQYPREIPLLLQDQNSLFKQYQQIKSLAEQAGFQHIHVALQP